MIAPYVEPGSFWLPKQSSTLAAQVDEAYSAVLWVSVVFFVLIVGATFFFAYRYRRNGGVKTKRVVTHNTRLEVIWTLIPLVIVIWLFFLGFHGYLNAAIAPAEAFEIQVTAQKWSWSFTYPNGNVSPNKLVIPKGRPVKLVMSSKDVLHSFFIPEFRVKQDVVPGTYTTVWFEATEAKETVLFCTEYCGTGHSEMLATVSIVEEPEFKKFLESGGEDKNLPPAEHGKLLLASYGCTACHSMDGTVGNGPSLKGVFNHQVELADGNKAMVDEAYIRESIMAPSAKVVKGFQPIMPTFKGQMKDAHVDALVAYIKKMSE